MLYGYYRGIVSSRRIAEACRRNIVFMALSADSRPHFTIIAAFVSNLEHEITSLFGDVLLYASELGLIGKEHFAIDGCKLPSNASKKWSGTHKAVTCPPISGLIPPPFLAECLGSRALWLVGLASFQGTISPRLLLLQAAGGSPVRLEPRRSLGQVQVG